jgi:integrase
MQAKPSAKRAYGSGSIFERDGNYYGKWRIDGRQVKRKLGPKRTKGEPHGLTRKQAETRVRELMAASQAEHDNAAKDAKRHRTKSQHGPTIDQVGRAYIEYAREHRGLKATTLGDYDCALRIHLAPFFGDRPVSEFDARLIEAYAKHLRTKPGSGWRGGKPLSPKTITNQLGALAVLLNFAMRRKWISASPMAGVDLPKQAGDAPIEKLKFLERDEVARLIEHAVPGEFQVLDRALYTLATYSGLRQGELRGLLWEHIDVARSIVHVVENVTHGRRSSPKGKRRRPVPLAPPAAEALLELRAVSPWTAPDDPVFAAPASGRPMGLTKLMERYREALAAAGLAVGFSFHDLRHTFGTNMARAGVPATTIQGWMGHADLQTTQRYMHYAPAHQDAARIAAALDPGTNPGTNLSETERTESNSEAA